MTCLLPNVKMHELQNKWQLIVRGVTKRPQLQLLQRTCHVVQSGEHMVQHRSQAAMIPKPEQGSINLLYQFKTINMSIYAVLYI